MGYLPSLGGKAPHLATHRHPHERDPCSHHNHLPVAIIGNKKGAVFGGFVEAPLRPIIQTKYQGTNNCLVFTNVAGRPVIYRPTGANNYFTFCSPKYLAMGGGAHFALYLDEDLELESDQEFPVQLWGFVSASEYD